MALSVASECAFSSAGITISKCCNHLNGDIVEALQCLKLLKAQDLMWRPFPSVADEEVLQDDTDMQLANQEGTTVEVVNDVEEWSLDVVVEDTYNDDDTIVRGGLVYTVLCLESQFEHLMLSFCLIFLQAVS